MHTEYGGCCPLPKAGCCPLLPVFSSTVLSKRAITAPSLTFYAFVRAPPCERVLLAISYMQATVSFYLHSS